VTAADYVEKAAFTSRRDAQHFCSSRRVLYDVAVTHHTKISLQTKGRSDKPMRISIYSTELKTMKAYRPTLLVALFDIS
jgi:hypothetical protein